MTDIRPAHWPEDLATVRTLFHEYAGTLGVDLGFQGFEAEVAQLPGKYLEPAGRLLLAWQGSEAVGCVCLRPLDASASEMKRLYVRPPARGEQLGRRLAERICAEARNAGYLRICLDTLPSMTARNACMNRWASSRPRLTFSIRLKARSSWRLTCRVPDVAVCDSETLGEPCDAHTVYAILSRNRSGSCRVQTDLKSGQTFWPSIALIALIAIPFCTSRADAGPEHGVRFDSPAVQDLALRADMRAGVAVPASILDAPTAAAILATPSPGEDQRSLPFSDDLFGCKSPSQACSVKGESALIGMTGGAIKRSGKRLSVSPASGAVVTFVDWADAQSKTADGDQETHWYLGRLPGSGYYRVEVQFGHDAPGSFLINPANGKIAFVHNGGDVAAISPDGRRLVTFNTLNPPLSIRVAALDQTGPRIQLQCEASSAGDGIQPIFKGWHDAQSFDLTFVVRAARSKLAHRIAVRISQSKISQNNMGWDLASSDKAQLDAIGLACRSNADLADASSH